MKYARRLIITAAVAVAIFAVARIAITQPITQTTLPAGNVAGQIQTGSPIDAADVLGNDQALLTGVNAIETLIGTNEGELLIPSSITPPFSGQVAAMGGGSFYVFSATVNVTHTVSLTSLTSDVSLFVTPFSDFSAFSCQSKLPGITDESCTAIPSTTGQLYVLVTPAAGAKATFTLGSAQDTGCCRDQGTPTVPMIVPFSLVQAGWTGAEVSTTSYYNFSGTPVGTPTTVRVTDGSPDGYYAAVTVYSGSIGSTTVLCGPINNSAGATVDCIFPATTVELFVRIEDNASALTIEVF